MGLRASHTLTHTSCTRKLWGRANRRGAGRDPESAAGPQTSGYKVLELNLVMHLLLTQARGWIQDEKEWVTMGNSIKDATTYICIVFLGGGQNPQRKQNGCKNWVHACRMWAWGYVKSCAAKGGRCEWGSVEKKENRTWRPFGWIVEGRS